MVACGGMTNTVYAAFLCGNLACLERVVFILVLTKGVLGSLGQRRALLGKAGLQGVSRWSKLPPAGHGKCVGGVSAVNSCTCWATTCVLFACCCSSSGACIPRRGPYRPVVRFQRETRAQSAAFLTSRIPARECSCPERSQSDQLQVSGEIPLPRGSYIWPAARAVV